MLSYNIFQRFCVLLLSIHGQVEKYASKNNGVQVTDTTSFLKNLNVYSAIQTIEKTIREKNFTAN